MYTCMYKALYGYLDAENAIIGMPPGFRQQERKKALTYPTIFEGALITDHLVDGVLFFVVFDWVALSLL
jgi:hypothetical protein